MSKSRGETDTEVKRDREYWFVAIQFWLVIAPIFLYGFVKASTMPAELLIALLSPGPTVTTLVNILFLVLGVVFSILMIRDIWKRLEISLANRDA